MTPKEPQLWTLKIDCREFANNIYPEQTPICGAMEGSVFNMCRHWK